VRVGDVGAFACLAVTVFLILRGWRWPFDHVIIVLASISGGLFLAVSDGSWLVGAGLGVSTAILANFALRASMPIPENAGARMREPVTVILLVWSELPLAGAAAIFWTTDRTYWALLLTALALSSVVINIVRILRHGERYWPDQSRVSRG
jgi:hypothetical protein